MQCISCQYRGQQLRLLALHDHVKIHSDYQKRDAKTACRYVGTAAGRDCRAQTLDQQANNEASSRVTLFIVPPWPLAWCSRRVRWSRSSRDQSIQTNVTIKRSVPDITLEIVTQIRFPAVEQPMAKYLQLNLFVFHGLSSSSHTAWALNVKIPLMQETFTRWYLA